MSHDSFKSRERAFEAVYFARADAEKIEEIHRLREAEAELDRLSSATGIRDQEVLRHILGVGVTSVNLEALSHVPLIAVAWANGDLEPAERKTALETLVADGAEEGSDAYRLFERWIEEPPSDELMNVWREYIHAVLEQLDAPARKQVQKDWVERAEKIARAAGGIAGIGSVSSKERGVLGEIVSALAG